MKVRHIGVLAVLILPSLLLTACGEKPPANVAPSSAPSTSTSTDPTLAPLEFAADVVLNVKGTVTADNGAKMLLTLMVHASKASSDPAAEAGVSTLSTVCSGELDSGVLSSGSYGIVQVDYLATLVGTTAWPTTLELMVTPTAQGVALAATGDIKQKEVLPAPFEAGDYVPHCKQNAFLSGPGTGTTFVALAGDASGTPPFERWVELPFGFSADSPAGFVGTTPFGGPNLGGVTFSRCGATVTALASTLGYSAATWSQNFSKYHCAVGGTTQSFSGT